MKTETDKLADLIGSYPLDGERAQSLLSFGNNTGNATSLIDILHSHTNYIRFLTLFLIIEHTLALAALGVYLATS